MGCTNSVKAKVPGEQTEKDRTASHTTKATNEQHNKDLI